MSQVAGELEPRQVMVAAKAYAREHLHELAADVLQWHHTAVLPDASRLRALAEMFEPIMKHGCLQLAESLVNSAALDFAALPMPRGWAISRVDDGLLVVAPDCDPGGLTVSPSSGPLASRLLYRLADDIVALSPDSRRESFKSPLTSPAVNT